MFRKVLVGLVGLFSVGVIGTSHVNAATDLVGVDQVTLKNVQKDDHAKLSVQKDEQKRSWLSHIIVRDKDEEGKRVGQPEAPVNLSKWLKNPQINDKIKGKQYLWNKGHGVGNQFGGEASNNAVNIAAETVYLNQVLMLHYEGSTKTPNSLDNWLYLHPHYALDYYVMFNYEKTGDQIPTSVTLAYRGLDEHNQPIKITLPNDTNEGSGKQVNADNEFTKVTLQNIEPGYVLDYKTGAYTQADGKKQPIHDGWEMAEANFDKILAGSAKLKETGHLWWKSKQFVAPKTTTAAKDAAGGITHLFDGGKGSSMMIIVIVIIIIIGTLIDG